MTGWSLLALAGAVVVAAWAAVLRETSRRPVGSAVLVVGLGTVGLLHLGAASGDTDPDVLRASRDLPAFHVVAVGDTTDDDVAGRVLATAVSTDDPIATDQVLAWPGGDAGGTGPVAMVVDVADVLGGRLVAGDVVAVVVDGPGGVSEALVVDVRPVTAAVDDAGAASVDREYVVTVMVPREQRLGLRREDAPVLVRTAG